MIIKVFTVQETYNSDLDGREVSDKVYLLTEKELIADAISVLEEDEDNENMNQIDTIEQAIDYLETVQKYVIKEYSINTTTQLSE